MPDPALSAAIQEAYASAPSGVIILHTLEIRHPDFAAPIRVVRNFADAESWVALGGTDVSTVLDAMDAAARDLVGLVAKLEDSAPADAGAYVAFLGLAFDFDLPPVESLAVPEITVTIDNVDRRITDALEGASTSENSVEVTYRPYLSNDISGPQMDPPITLILSEVKADLYKVTAQARMMDIGNKKFPSEVYTRKRFPGLTA